MLNVPKAHSRGIEAEFAVNPLPGLEFSVNGNVQKAEFDSTVVAGSGAIIGGIRKGQSPADRAEVPVRGRRDLWAAR